MLAHGVRISKLFFQNAMCKTLLKRFSSMIPKVGFVSRVLAFVAVLSWLCHQTTITLQNKRILHIANRICTCLISWASSGGGPHCKGIFADDSVRVTVSYPVLGASMG
jgi:hypothetical protein